MTSRKFGIMAQAVRDSYSIGLEDETLNPLVLVDRSGKPVGRIAERHSVIFYNIRGEREIELTESMTETGFNKFPVKILKPEFATMIEYRKGLNVRVGFPQEGIVMDTLSEVLSGNGLNQVKITEAEKAVHVTFFLNGKKEGPIPGEQRVIVPTRKDVSLFDEAPEMSIGRITDAIVESIHDPHCDCIVANFPNVDVVGHVENEKAVIEAVEVVDSHMGMALKAALAEGLTVIVTADHGTVEKWYYPDGAIDTGHTDSPVPFILISPGRQSKLRHGGELADIAPTVLDIFGISKPQIMSGCSLLYPDRALMEQKRRLLILILDGWGIQNPSRGNLISIAETPVMDKLLRDYPFTTLRASGEAVGLPDGTVGNSEVGHLHIGAGRRIYSDRLKIDRAIVDGSFFSNSSFLEVIRSAGANRLPLHLMGIVSFFSSHGSVNHLFALLEMAKTEGLQEVFIHAMLGRRGEQPESGANYIDLIEKKTAELRIGRVVSVIGRYWSMDREENWDRIEKAYNMLVHGFGKPVTGGDDR